MADWKDGLSVGHEGVDAEHDKLVETIGEIELAVRVDAADVEVRRLVCRLADEIDAHFLSEELLMRQRGVPDFEEHVADHDRLVARLEDLSRQLSDGRLEPAPELAGWLQDWFTRHVVKHDRKLGPGGP